MIETPQKNGRSGSDFTVMQQGVATRLGISEERVRELRARFLVGGVDFVKRGSRLLYSVSAVEKLAAGMTVPELPGEELHRGGGELNTEGTEAEGEAEQGRLEGTLAPPLEDTRPEEQEQKTGGLILVPRLYRVQVLKVWANPGYVGGILSLTRAEEYERGQLVAPSNALGDGWEAIPANADALTLLRVRVKHNRNLARGMVLRCVHIAEDLYEAVELPRRKGRW